MHDARADGRRLGSESAATEPEEEKAPAARVSGRVDAPQRGDRDVDTLGDVSYGRRDAARSRDLLALAEETAVLVRRLDHSKPAGEQESWRCVAIGSIVYALMLQVEITKRHEMEAGVVSLSAMNGREIARCREEILKSYRLFASPLGGATEGA